MVGIGFKIPVLEENGRCVLSPCILRDCKSANSIILLRHSPLCESSRTGLRDRRTGRLKVLIWTIYKHNKTMQTILFIVKRFNPLSPIDVYRRHLDPMHL